MVFHNGISFDENISWTDCPWFTLGYCILEKLIGEYIKLQKFKYFSRIRYRRHTKIIFSRLKKNKKIQEWI